LKLSPNLFSKRPTLIAARTMPVDRATPSDPDCSRRPTDAASVSRAAFGPGAIARSESVDEFRRTTSVKSLTSPVKSGRRNESDDDENATKRPKVLFLHCGGTLGMGLESFTTTDAQKREGEVVPVAGGKYRPLGASGYLLDILEVIPELHDFADIDVTVLMNKDSSEMNHEDWIALARALDASRGAYDAFIVVHGTDTMAFTASALSLMLVGFGKPIVLTGSQLPLAMARSDARQNLIDALTCCVASVSCGGTVNFAEVAICFGGTLLRGNRTQKTSATLYAAFHSPSYPALARLGVGVDWNHARLLSATSKYAPKFTLDDNVIRIPIIPGLDHERAYGDLHARGIRGIILEAFGVGNFPKGIITWLAGQKSKGLSVYLSTQCHTGELRPELYAAGLGALAMGAKSGPVMTSECAVVKMMLSLADDSVSLVKDYAGESEGVDFCSPS
jgi:L-asparaginase